MTQLTSPTAATPHIAEDSAAARSPSAATPIDYSQIRLPLPATVPPPRILWIYAVPISVIHLIALAAFVPWLFSWTGLIIAILGVHVFGQGINLCYHRQLTHKSFITSKWLEHFFVLVALCCMEDTPGRWVATHRYHHNHSDEQPDPHSPLVTFLWSHVGWLLVQNREMHRVEHYQKYARDILDDRFYMKLEKNRWLAGYVYLAHALLFFACGFASAWLIGGGLVTSLQFALSLVVWGVFVRTVIVWHITWSVNSLTHLFGYRNYDTDENSRNNWLVAILTVGEGWHNNHHEDPASASVQHRWWEVDITYYEIRLLEMLGLAKRVIQPKAIRHAGRHRAKDY